MRAILIDVKKQVVEYVDLPDDSTARMYEMHRLIGCSTYTMGGVLPTNDVLFVDDEGLLSITPDTIFFQIKGLQPLVGNGLILGAEDWDVETQMDVDLKLAIDLNELQLNIEFITLSEMQIRLAKERLAENLDLG